MGAFAHTVASAPVDEFLTFFGLGLVGFVVAAVVTYRSLTHKRLIEDTPTSRLRSVSQGFVELQGTAAVFEGEAIVSPVSNTPCCWYRYKVEERSSSGNLKNEDRWRTIESDTSTAIFKLDDGTGICGIDPEGARVTPSLKKVWYSNERHPWYEAATTGLAGWLGNKRYRFTEERIELGAALYALGHLITHGGAAPALAESDVAQILREWKADKAQLLARYDRNSNGEIDMDEWEAARSDARREAAAQIATAAVAPAVDLLAKPRGGGRPFIIAATHEDDLRARHLRHLAAGLVIAVGLGVLGVWALVVRFG